MSGKNSKFKTIFLIVVVLWVAVFGINYLIKKTRKPIPVMQNKIEPQPVISISHPEGIKAVEGESPEPKMKDVPHKVVKPTQTAKVPHNKVPPAPPSKAPLLPPPQVREKGWIGPVEKHYDRDKFIQNLKEKYIPKEVREIDHTKTGYKNEEVYLRKELKKKPTDKNLLYLLAYNQFDRENYIESQRVFETILKHHPKEERAEEGRVYSIYKKEEFMEARSEAQKALKKFPKNARLMHMLGGSYLYGERDPEKAVKIYEKAVKTDPHDERLWLGLAESYVEMKTPKASDKAIEVMKETIRRFPKYHIVFILLAEEYQLRGEYGKALVKLEEAIERDPLYYRGYSIIGDIYRDLGRYDTALKYYIRTVKTNPRYEALIFIKLGNLYRDLGKLDDAEKYYKTAIELHLNKDPDDDDDDVTDDSSDTKVDRELDVDKIDVIDEDARDEDEINIEKSMAYCGLAQLEIDRKDLKEAQKFIDLANKDYPQYEYISYIRGMLALAKGKYARAVKDIKVCEKDDTPENSIEDFEIEYGLARVYAVKGDNKKAIEHLKKTVDKVQRFRKLAVINRVGTDSYFASLRKSKEWLKFRKQFKELEEKAKKLKTEKKYVK